MKNTKQVLYTDSHISQANSFNILAEYNMNFLGMIKANIAIFSYRDSYVNKEFFGVKIDFIESEEFKEMINDEVRLLLINSARVKAMRHIKIRGKRKKLLIYNISEIIKNKCENSFESICEFTINKADKDTKTVNFIFSSLDYLKYEHYDVTLLIENEIIRDINWKTK